MLRMLFPADDCRKRWKSLRDTHRKERKKEKVRCRSGAEVSTSRPWRYSQIMAFLNPFTEDRATSSNLPTGDSQGQGDGGITGENADADNEFSLILQPVPLELPEDIEAPSHTFPFAPTTTPSPSPSPSPSTSRETSRPRAQKRPHEDSLSPFERQLMCAVEKAVTQTAPPDPDSQIFEGLLPDLKSLSARRKADVKFKIHQLIFEATCQQLDEDV